MNVVSIVVLRTEFKTLCTSADVKGKSRDYANQHGQHCHAYLQNVISRSPACRQWCEELVCKMNITCRQLLRLIRMQNRLLPAHVGDAHNRMMQSLLALASEKWVFVVSRTHFHFYRSAFSAFGNAGIFVKTFCCIHWSIPSSRKNVMFYWKPMHFDFHPRNTCVLRRVEFSFQ